MSSCSLKKNLATNCLNFSLPAPKLVSCSEKNRTFQYLHFLPNSRFLIYDTQKYMDNNFECIYA